jgi:hypothetical protein
MLKISQIFSGEADGKKCTIKSAVKCNRVPDPLKRVKLSGDALQVINNG